jgi:exopolyphosphatase / guanosine-5'-triphosphate,3'-diphosphate pyrophosphatase
VIEPEPRAAAADGGEGVTRVAAIDCGTNSVRLLLADIGGGRLTDLERRMEIVRLGQGVDRTGMLAPEALDRTFAAMRGYAKLIDAHGTADGQGPVKVRVVATSATRDAANRADFVDGVVDIFGVEPEVITGDVEAALSFAGATRDLVELRPARPYLVVDIGGGSTEFVLGTGSVEAARSVDIGCVRMTERHLRDGDPPTPEQIAAAVADIDAQLAVVRETVPVDQARTLVGLAGSVTTIAGIALGLPEYDPERIHLSRITASQVHEVTRMLLRATHDERAAIGVMHAGRVDVIGAGALILDRIMREYGFGAVVVSEHDILDGIAWSLV